ncbi:hypothetical protein A3Q56_01105 [Intoshia linei]|uniref:Integrator complex subunit 5 C-terminal domain-containing protein n=1 Tax=Intoshia linei TaxID=1819745 RepID=A0A177BAB8_9BILA|nr:hypothetical protein A3Q56_01105 [Intoshia linei]
MSDENLTNLHKIDKFIKICAIKDYKDYNDHLPLLKELLKECVILRPLIFKWIANLFHHLSKKHHTDELTHIGSEILEIVNQMNLSENMMIELIKFYHEIMREVDVKSGKLEKKILLLTDLSCLLNFGMKLMKSFCKMVDNCDFNHSEEEKNEYDSNIYIRHMEYHFMDNLISQKYLNHYNTYTVYFLEPYYAKLLGYRIFENVLRKNWIQLDYSTSLHRFDVYIDFINMVVHLFYIYPTEFYEIISYFFKNSKLKSDLVFLLALISSKYEKFNIELLKYLLLQCNINDFISKPLCSVLDSLYVTYKDRFVNLISLLIKRNNEQNCAILKLLVNSAKQERFIAVILKAIFSETFEEFVSSSDDSYSTSNMSWIHNLTIDEIFLLYFESRGDCRQQFKDILLFYCQLKGSLTSQSIGTKLVLTNPEVFDKNDLIDILFSFLHENLDIKNIFLIPIEKFNSDIQSVNKNCQILRNTQITHLCINMHNIYKSSGDILRDIMIDLLRENYFLFEKSFVFVNVSEREWIYDVRILSKCNIYSMENRFKIVNLYECLLIELFTNQQQKQCSTLLPYIYDGMQMLSKNKSTFLYKYGITQLLNLVMEKENRFIFIDNIKTIPKKITGNSAFRKISLKSISPCQIIIDCIFLLCSTDSNELQNDSSEDLIAGTIYDLNEKCLCGLAKEINNVCMKSCLYQNIIWPNIEFIKVSLDSDLLVMALFKEIPLLWDIIILVSMKPKSFIKMSPIIRSLMSIFINEWGNCTINNFMDSSLYQNSKKLLYTVELSNLIEYPWMTVLNELFNGVTTTQEILIIICLVWKHFENLKLCMQYTPTSTEVNNVFKKTVDHIIYSNVTKFTYIYTKYDLA